MPATPATRSTVVSKLVIGVALATIALPAAAQDDDGPRRTRVIAGAQVGPAYPGATRGQVTPYLDLSRTRGDRDYAFEAPDESTSISLYRSDSFSIGPAINFQSKRRRRDAGGLDEVDFAVELGAAAQLTLAPSVRATAEVRRGVTGHSGFVGMVGADYVQRDGNRWLWSVGPRVTLGDARFARAYFGVTPRETLATGIASYRPGSMVMVGGTGSLLYQFTPRWGVFGFGKYDRIVGDAADSPVTRRFGARNQWSAGGGVSYTFGRNVR